MVLILSLLSICVFIQINFSRFGIISMSKLAKISLFPMVLALVFALQIIIILCLALQKCPSKLQSFICKASSRVREFSQDNKVLVGKRLILNNFTNTAGLFLFLQNLESRERGRWSIFIHHDL